MDNVLVTAGILVVPTLIVVIGFRVTGRKIEWVPLFWAGCAFSVYFLLLRSKGVIPTPLFLEELDLNWFGKTMTLLGTLAMVYFIPSVGFEAIGLTWRQNSGSLPHVISVGVIFLLVTTGTAMLLTSTPNTSLENLLFQASMPGLDEELFFHGLLLLLFHQAFGKALKVLGAETGWGFWIVVAIFGLLHGVRIQSGELAVNFGAIVGTAFTGLVLIWMRERTGSLVVPVLYHNIFNIAQALV